MDDSCPVIETSYSGFYIPSIINTEADANSEHLACEVYYELYVLDTSTSTDPTAHTYVKWEKLHTDMKNKLREVGQGTLTD